MKSSHVFQQMVQRRLPLVAHLALVPILPRVVLDVQPQRLRRQKGRRIRRTQMACVRTFRLRCVVLLANVRAQLAILGERQRTLAALIRPIRGVRPPMVHAHRERARELRLAYFALVRPLFDRMNANVQLPRDARLEAAPTDIALKWLMNAPMDAQRFCIRTPFVAHNTHGGQKLFPLHHVVVGVHHLHVRMHRRSIRVRFQADRTLESAAMRNRLDGGQPNLGTVVGGRRWRRQHSLSHGLLLLALRKGGGRLIGRRPSVPHERVRFEAGRCGEREAADLAHERAFTGVRAFVLVLHVQPIERAGTVRALELVGTTMVLHVVLHRSQIGFAAHVTGGALDLFGIVMDAAHVVDEQQSERGINVT